MIHKFKLLTNKIKYVIGLYKSYYFPDKFTKVFIEFNKSMWADWKVVGSEKVILFDYHPLAETEISRSYLLNVLARKFNAKIVSFSLEQPRKNLWFKVYQSYNVADHVSVELNSSQQVKSKKLFAEVMADIKNKSDVYNLTLFDVWLGVDVYEEYLMRYTQPTFNLQDNRAIDIIQEGIDALIFWLDYLEGNKVMAVVSSHLGVRIEKNLVCKIAGKIFNIPFYSTNAINVSYCPEPHTHHKFIAQRYRNYVDHFNKLPQLKKEEGIIWAKKQLGRRLAGEAGVNMPWNTKSSFLYDKANAKRVLVNNNKIKLLICTHEFYDSPNWCGGLLFPDFYEWLLFLGKISEKTDYDWYVKTHPDASNQAKEVISSIADQYKRLIIIPPETSHHQLIDEGIKFVLTCYGSVGCEYPLLGAQVINAGNNPHIGYDFNWHPNTLDEYENLLLNLKTLKKDIQRQDVYEFYYMHNKAFGPIDDWIFKSYKKMKNELSLNQRFGTYIFKYFMDEIDENRHQIITSNFQKFIDSKKIGGLHEQELYE